MPVASVYALCGVAGTIENILGRLDAQMVMGGGTRTRCFLKSTSIFQGKYILDRKMVTSSFCYVAAKEVPVGVAID